MSNFYQNNLNTLVPKVLLDMDSDSGDFQTFLDVLSPTLDSFTDLIDQLGDHFSPSTIDASLLPYLAQFLGIALDEGDSTEDKRAILSKTVQLYQRKGTQLSYTVYMSNLGFDAQFVKLWTEDYLTFSPSPGSLVEDGGTWYLSAHTNVNLVSQSPTVTIDATTIAALLSRIKRFLPIQLVLGTVALSMVLSPADAVDPDDEQGTLSIFISALQDPAQNDSVDPDGASTFFFSESYVQPADLVLDTQNLPSGGNVDALAIFPDFFKTFNDEVLGLNNNADGAPVDVLSFPSMSSQFTDIVNPADPLFVDITNPVELDDTLLNTQNLPNGGQVSQLAINFNQFLTPSDPVLDASNLPEGGSVDQLTRFELAALDDTVRIESVYIRDQGSPRTMPHKRDPVAGAEVLRTGHSDELLYEATDTGVPQGENRV